ncbi:MULTISPECIES: glycoside hydrolase domain-containing protein [unclassified Mucilaginibacter]|uniref:glycoside hydrolase domain-containing protein n=1 Tax=unclassified Mucilaginibacter TaxID=2617802 RepID=UPI002AC9F0D4|nr:MULTISPECIES: glycoside hydrolase domain-containing protein [unclassified Mucilaginibacter]MEB0263183.1 glycoside hydrolase family 92 protein [Mucilaginibacter sp. 10I4]MEB0280105.1 glycoside hydrolase family 92 protein [Mucilaginibacter sp. 10B2]MEB0301059.1 glycoside hydrolase family 92 protein [Mucilaginibacter sp. 5C4]WPX24486.1 glycoside hydrolase family 92 protein [Mucilaginibacter sp. 5C4]
MQPPKKVKAGQQADLTQYVDQLIGTGFHGHIFVGANVPFGAVQLGPTQLSKGWDWCSGYHISDSTIIGFQHTHLSGTGIGDNFYTTKPDGIIGNEDVGQMSAWYVLSTLGFYPVNPANGMYVFGSPHVKEATISPSDKKFHILVKNNSAANKYIASITLNGKPHLINYLPHSVIAAGGEMVITMSAKPTLFGTSPESRPRSVN